MIAPGMTETCRSWSCRNWFECLLLIHVPQYLVYLPMHSRERHMTLIGCTIAAISAPQGNVRD